MERYRAKGNRRERERELKREIGTGETRERG